MSLSLHQLRGPGVIGARSGGACQKRTVRQSANNGACRSEGLERLVAGQHVPDRLGQFPSELDLRDLRAALAAQAALGALVALLVERCEEAAIAASISPQRKYLGPCLASGPRRSTSPDWLTRGHRPV